MMHNGSDCQGWPDGVLDAGSDETSVELSGSLLGDGEVSSPGPDEGYEESVPVVEESEPGKDPAG